MGINIYNTSVGFDLVAISAAIIALCALAVSIWQAYLGRKHNRLSARPLLEFYCSSTADKGISATVKNCGPGPAIINSTWITYNKTKYNVSDRTSFQRLVNAWYDNGAPESMFYAASPHSKAIVGPGDSFDIMRVTDTKDMNMAIRFFSSAFRDTIIEIGYESLYGEKFTAKYEQETFHSA